MKRIPAYAKTPEYQEAIRLAAKKWERIVAEAETAGYVKRETFGADCALCSMSEGDTWHYVLCRPCILARPPFLTGPGFCHTYWQKAFRAYIDGDYKRVLLWSRKLLALIKSYQVSEP